MPLPFTTDQDLLMIKMIELNPVIYNKAIAGKDTKEMAWQKIGEALQKPVTLCKARWSSIRDNLRRNIRLRLKKAKSLDFQGKVFNKCKYEDRLGFLITFLKEKLNDSEDYEVEEQEGSEIQKTEEIYLVVDEDNKENTEANSVDKRDRRVKSSSNEIVSTSVHDQEHIKAFLSAIEATLGGLNPYYLNEAKSKIFNIVQDCELQQIINKGKRPGDDDDDDD